MYFLTAVGNVYESQGSDELALENYMVHLLITISKLTLEQKAKDIGDRLPIGHPDVALSYMTAGAIYYHMQQFELALEHFKKGLGLRQRVCIFSLGLITQ